MPYQAEREQLARRQKLVDMLQKQSLSPQQTQMVSGRAVPQGLLQGISPVLQAMMAKEQGGDLAAQRQALDTQQAQSVQAGMKDVMTQFQGRPAEVLDEGRFGPAAPAVQGDPAKAAMMTVGDPRLQGNKPAQAMMGQLMRNRGAGGPKPYNRAFPTTEGWMSHDVRSGDISPMMSNGKQLLPPQYDVERQTNIAGGKAAGRETSSGNVKRYQTWVQDGVAAADAMAVTKKAKDLLSDIRTSGFASVVLRAKQFMGVEGADEGQLSANLGKAVLSQLRPTFGAQFTASEGAKLERIEAGFGSSVESNIRLLDQTLQIFDRAARRGQSAAKKLGDNFSYDEIGRSMEMKINGAPEKPKKVEPTSLEYNDIIKEDAYQKWKASQK